MNKDKEIVEVIDGLHNLAAIMKDENDSMKKILENKNLTIVECKKEYRRLHAEHEQLKKKYAELESKIEKNEKIKRKRKNNINNNNNKKKKKKILIDYSSDENDEYDDKNNEKSSEEEEEEEEDKNSDFEIVKVKKNKKKTNQKKVKKVKGIMDYINSRNN